MNGIIVINKQPDWTSFDVVAKSRGIFNTKKIGHSGTLDPMATGVLPLFIGRASRAVDMQENDGKRYTATILFGKKTDTGDITGTVLEEDSKIVSLEDLENVLPEFIGEQEQIPPMYSAVKINGQPLYKMARRGVTIERKPREIYIDFIKVLSHDDENTFVIDVKCRKGTYIRTLIEDIATKLGTIATMTALTRTESGNYDISQSFTLDEIQKAKEDGVLESLLVSVESVFDYPRLDCDEEVGRRMKNGAICHWRAKDGTYKLYINDEFYGVITMTDGLMEIVKLFCERG